MFSNTFAGISPSSVPSFVGAQVVGGAAALIVIKVLYPDITPSEAADIMFPHHHDDGGVSVSDDGSPLSPQALVTTKEVP